MIGCQGISAAIDKIVYCLVRIFHSFQIAFEWRHWWDGYRCPPSQRDWRYKMMCECNPIDTNNLWFFHCGKLLTCKYGCRTCDYYRGVGLLCKAAIWLFERFYHFFHYGIERLFFWYHRVYWSMICHYLYWKTLQVSLSSNFDACFFYDRDSNAEIAWIQDLIILLWYEKLEVEFPKYCGWSTYNTLACSKTFPSCFPVAHLMANGCVFDHSH